MFNCLIIPAKRVRINDIVKIAGKKRELTSISTFYGTDDIEFGFVDKKTKTYVTLRVDKHVPIKIYR